ncbi:MAG: class I SAM-dependent methyltransferase [Dermatophilaceae bacterium]
MRLRRHRGESDTDRQRRVWDDAALGYDRQIAPFDRLWFTGGREWLGERATGRVLEVAIGTGLTLPHYRDDVVLTGVDLSPAMVRQASARAGSLRRTIDLRAGDAAALPAADGLFDTVVCALGLCSIPDPAGAIAEMRRVLVPGGRLLLLDHVGSTCLPVRAGQWLVERVTIRMAGEHFTRRQRPLVEAAGFDVVEAERLKAGTVERLHATTPVG